MDAARSPETKIAPIRGADETIELKALKVRLYNATNESLKTRVSMTQGRMHKLPHYLRGIGGADGRYVVPSVVAIGRTTVACLTCKRWRR